MAPPKDPNNLPLPDSKDIEISYLPDKRFKTRVLRKLNELQESIARQFNKV